MTLLSDALGQGVKLRVDARPSLGRAVGGLDNTTSDDKLSTKARKVKREIAKKAKEAAPPNDLRLS